MDPISSAAVDTDIAKLETLLRQLKVQYDMFLAGGSKEEPVELRAQVERLVRKYSNTSLQKYSQSFHLNTLISRYASFSELWRKSLRQFETGEKRLPGLPERAAAAEGVVASVRVGPVATEDKGLRGMYQRFLSARHKLGEERPLSYENFLRGVRSQSERLRQQTGCGQIELRLVVRDNKAQLVARPSR